MAQHDAKKIAGAVSAYSELCERRAGYARRNRLTRSRNNLVLTPKKNRTLEERIELVVENAKKGNCFPKDDVFYLSSHATLHGCKVG